MKPFPVYNTPCTLKEGDSIAREFPRDKTGKVISTEHYRLWIRENDHLFVSTAQLKTAEGLPAKVEVNSAGYFSKMKELNLDSVMSLEWEIYKSSQ